MASNTSKDAKKIKNNNFFNLSSDEEDSQEEQSNEEEFQAKIRKWDWDREENKEIYYKKESKETTKRFKPTENQSNLSLTNEAEKKRFCIEKLESNSSFKYDLLGHNSSVNRIHWSKKNPNLLLASSMDNKISIWNLNEANRKNPVQILDKIHLKSIRNAIWSNQETEIISVSYDQSSVLLNAETGQETNRLKHKSILTAIANHPTDEHIALIGANNEILSWDVRTNKPSKTYKYKSSIGQIQDLLFLNNNEFISCGDVVCKESAENSIIAWDFKSTASISQQIFHEKYIATCLKKHPTNALFLAQTHGNYIAEFSSRPPFKMNKFKRFESNGHFTAGYSIGFDINPNGSILCSGSSNGCIYLYNFHTSKLIKRLDGSCNKYASSQPCMDVKFQPNSNEKLLAASFWNGTIKIFEF